MKNSYFLTIFLFTSCIFFNSCVKKKQTQDQNKVLSQDLINENLSEVKLNSDDVPLTYHPINVDKTILEWIGKKTTGTHNGTVKISKGVLGINQNGEIVNGKFKINMEDIQCDDLTGSKKESIETHLKDEDFFNTQEYPEANFTITNIDGKKIIGVLTIKDISKEINFEYVQKNDLEYTAEIIVNRTLFDIKYKSKTFFPELGDHFIHDDFIIKLNPLVISPK